MPPFSAPLIDTYKQANGIILGKMNLAELSTSIGSINPNMPGNNITTPLNPYNQTKIPGGILSLGYDTVECALNASKKEL